MNTGPTPLPEELEAAVYDALLDQQDPAASETVLDALCEQHPAHTHAVRRLAERVLAGSRATEGVPRNATPGRPRIGRYELESELGRGGFGVVYRAQQLEPLRRQVAVKVLAPDLDAEAVHARFTAERQILARLAHPHIARIHDAGTTDTGCPWFAMEFIDGPTITEWAQRSQPRLDDLLEVFLQVCDAVQHAHQQGVIHRDLKPSNVLVATVDGQPFAKVIDFGIAKAIDEPRPGPDATIAGALIGTPEYMSPEQALGEVADTRSDVFGLGGLLYRLLTGSPPRNLGSSDSLEALQRDAKSATPKRPSRHVVDSEPRRAASLRGDLDWICLTALHRDPEQRYASVAELSKDLRRHLENRPILARPPSFGYVLTTTWRRHRARVLAVGAAATLIISSAIAMTVLWLDARDQEKLATSRAKALDASFDQLQQVTDPLLAAERSRVAEQELWPALPERIAVFDSWLQQVEPLAARLANGAPDAEERQRLAASIFAIKARRETARQIGEQLEADRETWREARAAIQADPRFRGFELSRLAGLSPLGADPDSGLQEFAHLLSGSAPRRDSSGKLIAAEENGMVLILVPGGTTRIGAQSADPSAPHYDEDAGELEGPVHTVDLSPFLISKWEITQGQWQRMSGEYPSRHHHRVIIDDRPHNLMHPVEQVQWVEAVEILDRHDLALPTETAWEHAARGGSDDRWLGAEQVTDFATRHNIADRSYRRVKSTGTTFEQDLEDGWPVHAPVGTFAANDFGLHDVLGNVYELTSSRMFSYRTSASPGRGEREEETIKQSMRNQRVFRGGAYSAIARVARVSRRSVVPEDARSSQIGLRPIRWLDQP